MRGLSNCVHCPYVTWFVVLLNPDEKFMTYGGALFSTFSTSTTPRNDALPNRQVRVPRRFSTPRFGFFNTPYGSTGSVSVPDCASPVKFTVRCPTMPLD